MKLSFVVFVCLISNALSNSLQTVLTRVRRWGNGDMGTSDLSNMFRGTAGVDYPDLKTIPNTNFRCEDQIYEGGLYADVETRCQVYHVCHDGRKNSFLCGKGTIFNQQILACDYWYSADCESAPNYYHLNSQIGESSSANNLDNNSQQGIHHYNTGNIGGSQRLPNAGSNAQHPGGSQILPNAGGNVQQPGGSQRFPNAGGNVQQPGGSQRFPNAGGNAQHPGGSQRLPNAGGNVQQPGGSQRFPNAGGNAQYPGGNQRLPNARGNVQQPGGSQRLPNAGGNVQQPGGSHRLPNAGGNVQQPGGSNQQSCCCLKNSNQRPWSFPAGMMHGDK